MVRIPPLHPLEFPDAKGQWTTLYEFERHADAWAALDRGPMQLWLIREPDNEVDKHAVQAWSSSGPVGYIGHHHAIGMRRPLEEMELDGYTLQVTGKVLDLRHRRAICVVPTRRAMHKWWESVRSS